MLVPYAAGPFIQIATFCRDVVEQADGGVTLVGVLDAVELEPDDEGRHVAAMLAFISVRAGAMAGKHRIRIQPDRPGLLFPDGDLSAFFDGGLSGLEAQVEVVFVAVEQGLYWFEVLLDDELLLTKIPLQIRFAAENGSAG
jgi:hypothetical protein